MSTAPNPQARNPESPEESLAQDDERVLEAFDTKALQKAEEQSVEVADKMGIDRLNGVPVKIDDDDFERAPEEIEDKLDALAINSFLALGDLFDSFDPESFDQQKQQLKQQPDAFLTHLPLYEKNALEIISMCFAEEKSETSLGKYIQSAWPGLVDSVSVSFLLAKQAQYEVQGREGRFSSEQIDTALANIEDESQEKKGALKTLFEGIGESVKEVGNFLKKHKKEVGIFLVITTALYVAKGLFGKNDKEGKGFFDWIKGALGIGTLGGAGVLLEKFLSGDFEGLFGAFQKKVEEWGEEKAQKWIAGILGEENAEKFLNWAQQKREVLDGGFEKLSDEWQQRKKQITEWCNTNGINTEWLPDFKNIYEEYIAANPALSATAITLTPILTWWFFRSVGGSGLKVFLGGLISKKAIVTVGTLTALSVILFEDEELIQNGLKKLGFTPNEDGKVEFLKEIAEKTIDAAKWLNGKVNSILYAFGFEQAGANVVKGGAALLTARYGKETLQIAKIALPLGVVATALYGIDEVIKNSEEFSEFPNTIDGQTALLQEIIRQIAEKDEEVLAFRDELLEFLMNPEEMAKSFRERYEEKIVYKLGIKGTNFTGNFIAAFGMQSLDLLTTLAEDTDGNTHTKELLQEASERGFEGFDIFRFMRALYSDGHEIMIDKGRIQILWKTGKWVVLTKSKVHIDAMVEAVKSPFSKEHSWLGQKGMLETFVMGNSFFITIGATAGGIKNFASPEHGIGRMKSMAKGAARGATFEMQLAKAPFLTERIWREPAEWAKLKRLNVEYRTLRALEGTRVVGLMPKPTQVKALEEMYRVAYKNRLFWEEGKGKGKQSWTKQGRVNVWAKKMDNIEKVLKTKRFGMNDADVEDFRNKVRNTPEMRELAKRCAEQNARRVSLRERIQSRFSRSTSSQKTSPNPHPQAVSKPVTVESPKVKAALNEATPTEKKAILEILKHPKYQSFLQNAMKYGGVTLTCTFLYSFEQADDKIEFLVHAGKSYGALAAGIEGFKRSPGHPLAKLTVAIAVAGTTWIAGDYVSGKLDKWMPNRNQDVTGWIQAQRGFESLGMTLGGGAMSLIDLGFESAGIKGGVDEHIDPLEYLSKTVTLGSRFRNYREGVFAEYLTRNMTKLKQETQKTLDEYNRQLGRLDEELQHTQVDGWEKRADYLREQAIPKLTSFIDGTWVEEKQLELLIQQDMILQPATDAFIQKAEEIDPEQGKDFIPHLLNRIERNSALVTSDSENVLWGKLLETSVETTGHNINFRDYVSYYTLLSSQLRKIGEIQKEGNISGKRL